MSRYTVAVTFGRRRPWVQPPPDGPCQPPYLDADAGARTVIVEADTDQEATLLAAWMLCRPADRRATNPIWDVGDMVTATEILAVEL